MELYFYDLKIGFLYLCVFFRVMLFFSLIIIALAMIIDKIIHDSKQQVKLTFKLKLFIALRVLFVLFCPNPHAMALMLGVQW